MYYKASIKTICLGLKTSDKEIVGVLKVTWHHDNNKYYKAVLKRNEYRMEFNMS